jgi:hypothetical protein
VSPANAAVASFRPDKGIIAVALLPALIALVSLGLELSRGTFQWDVFAYSLIYTCAIIVAFGRFKVTFEEGRLIYRRWGATVSVEYAEIDNITVVTNSRGKPVRAIIHTRRGIELPFWWKLFPADVAKRFFALAPVNDAVRRMS